MKHIILLIIVVFALTACEFPSLPSQTETDPSVSNIREGTQGVSMAFVDSQNEFIVDSNSNIEEPSMLLSVELSNVGAFPQPEQSFSGQLWLSGFDREVLAFTPESNANNDAVDFIVNEDVLTLDGSETLKGKTAFNPIGGKEVFTFAGKINKEALKGLSSYKPNILANLCYEYETIANPPVCIDNQPQVREPKACSLTPITLSSQGAPIAVTAIEQRAVSGTLRYLITIERVAAGTAYLDREACINGKSTKGFDHLTLIKPTIDRGSRALDCRTLSAGDDTIRLIEGKATIECTIALKDLDTTRSAHITPLDIGLEYWFRQSIGLQSTITIINE